MFLKSQERHLRNILDNITIIETGEVKFQIEKRVFMAYAHVIDLLGE